MIEDDKKILLAARVVGGAILLGALVQVVLGVAYVRNSSYGLQQEPKGFFLVVGSELALGLLLIFSRRFRKLLSWGIAEKEQRLRRVRRKDI